MVAALEIDLAPGPPKALVVTASPAVVPRAGKTRVSVDVLDGCSNVVADGWGITLRAERGRFDNESNRLTLPTDGGSVRARLRVDDEPGPLRVTASWSDEIGETMISVSPRWMGLYVPYTNR